MGKEPLKIKDILPVIQQVKADLDRYYIRQVQVARMAGVDQGRLSLFLRGKAYTKKHKNDHIIETCQKLINEKKIKRGEILPS